MRTIVLIVMIALLTIIVYNIGRNSYQFEKAEYFESRVPCPNFIIDGEGNSIQISDKELQLLIKSLYVHLGKEDSLRVVEILYPTELLNKPTNE